jgi:hypothetical protein
MATNVYRFEFAQHVPLKEAEMTLQLASIAAEGLFGEARVRLELDYFVDEPYRTIIVDGTTEVGQAVVRIFTGLALVEYGRRAFCVQQVEPCPITRIET